MNGYLNIIGKALTKFKSLQRNGYKYNNQRPNMAMGGITPKQRLAMVA
jgi:hypothetical protein